MIEDRIKEVWAATEALREEAYDMQPSERKEVALNLTKFIANDLKYIAHKFGIKLP